MKIHYYCERCGVEIAEIDVPYDEAKLGFDCLTSEERKDIINKDLNGDALHVKTVCDSCMEESDEEPGGQAATFIYAGMQALH